MKKIILTILTAFATSHLHAQWTVQNIATITSELYGISFNGVNNIFIAQTNGLLKSTNGGSSWNLLPLEDQLGNPIAASIIYDTYFFDANNGVASGLMAMGNSEVILRTSNGGVNWTAVNTYNFGNLPRLIHDLYFPISSIGYAVGTNGRILKSTDAGLTWTVQISGTTNNLHSVFFTNATDGIAVGNQIILKTTNGGSSWTPTNFPFINFRSVHFTNASVGLAVGSASAAYKTIDGGNSWIPMPTSLVADFADAYMYDTDTAFIASDEGVAKSINGGSYWVFQPSAGNYQYNAVAFNSLNTGWAVGGGGRAVKTITCGDTIPHNDADAISIQAFPFNSCPGSYPVDVRIKNWGLNTLTSVDVNWTINGIPQPTFTWIGTLLTDSSSAYFTIGNCNFNYSTLAVRAWTSNPNGQTDGYTANDSTSSANFSTNRLHGIYTIGGSLPDYATFNAAVSALNTNGICGNITFKLRNGTYSGSTTINQINSTLTDTVTFESELGDSTQVILTSLGTTLTINGARNLIFKKMTITSGGSTVARPVNITNGASHIFLLNNILQGTNGYVWSSDFYNLTIGGGASTCDSIILMNNRIKNGSRGITMAGAGSMNSIGNVIENNIIEDQNYACIYINQQAGARIVKNTLSTTDLGSFGFYCNTTTLQSTEPGTHVLKNRISLPNGVGMSLNTLSGTLGNEFLVANNFISSEIGIGIGQSNYVNIYHNSVYAIDEPIDVSSGTTPTLNILNNIFVNFGTDVYGSFVATAIDSLDYNCYYTTGILGQQAFELWKMNFVKDTNSIFINPQFISNADLHIYPQTTNYALSNRGVPVAGVSDDIDGDIRNSSTPDIGADEFLMPLADAGIDSLQQTQRICPGINPVSVKIKNYGSATLNTVQVHWTVNAISQPVYNWNGNLSSGASSAFINIGTYNFIASNSYTIKIWTNNPNTQADLIPVNDTLTFSVIASGLSGVYTIGGVSPNYINFTAAKNALVINGVCGPVIFRVRPGTYTESVSFPQIAGASPYSTITFESENGDSSSVSMTYSLSTINHYTLMLDGADYFTFKKLSFFASGTNNYYYNSVVFIKNSSNYNQFLNNRFEAADLFFMSGVVTCDTTLDEFNVFQNNLFSGARHYGLKIYGKNIANTKFYEKGTVVKDNIFNSQHDESTLVLWYQMDPLIEGNQINISAPASKAISISWSMRNIKVLKNKVEGAVPMGIFLERCASGMLQRGEITNNFASITNGFPLYLSESSYQNVLFNNLAVHGSPSSYSLYITGNISLTSHINLYNNNFTNFAGGYVVYTYDPINHIENSDYNNLYTTGSQFSQSYPTVLSWRAATGFDSSSVSVNPSYYSNTDLHINNNATLMGAGLYMATIPYDIDGDLRKTTGPDIGADEFATVFGDLQTSGWVNIGTPPLCGNQMTMLNLVIQNNSNFPVSNFSIYTQMTGPFNQYDTFFYAQSLPAFSSDTLLTGPFNTSFGGIFNFKSYSNAVLDTLHSNDTSVTSLTFLPVTIPVTTPPSGQVIYCPGDSTVFSSSPAVSYLWSTGDTTQSILVTSAGTYYVTTTDANGCSATSLTVTAIYLPAPATPVIYTGSGNTIYTGTIYITYQWYLNSNIIPGATSSTYTAAQSGIYTVVVTDINGCSATSAPYNHIFVGFEESPGENTAKVIPNPTNGLFQIIAPDLQKGRIEIYNAIGEIIYESGLYSKQINISTHPKGIYLVKIMSGDKVLLKKIMYM